MKKWQSDALLPIFRSDLVIRQGPLNRDGSPSYRLFDPVADAYYLIGWRESLIFYCMRPGMRMRDLKKNLESQTSALISEDEILAFFEDLSNKKLFDERITEESLYAEGRNHHVSWLKATLGRHLERRISLPISEQILAKSLPYARLLAFKGSWLLYLALTLSGFILLILHLKDFYSHLFSLTPVGMLLYLLLITAVRALRELSGAYTALYYGGRTKSIGMRLILFWPLLYIDLDTRDLAKRLDKRQQITLLSAGMIAEMVLAGIATLAWSATSGGTMRETFFLIASASWISALMIDLNPAFKSNGYAILCTLFEIEHLQNRASAVLRDTRRYFFLGLESAKPKDPSPVMRALLIFYSLFRWGCRFLLYGALSLILYFALGKSVGLMCTSILLFHFFLKPIFRELKEIFSLRGSLRLNARLCGTLTVILLSAIWLLFPHPITLSSEGVVIAHREQILHSEKEGITTKIFVDKGDRVAAGEVLMRIQGAGLPIELKAEISGEIVEWKSGLHNRRFIKEGERIGRIATLPLCLMLFIDEGSIPSISEKGKLLFFPYGSDESFAATLFPRDTSERSSLSLYRDPDDLGPHSSIGREYPFTAEFEGRNNLTIGQGGIAEIEGKSRSRLILALHWLYSLFEKTYF